MRERRTDYTELQREESWLEIAEVWVAIVQSVHNLQEENKSNEKTVIAAWSMWKIERYTVADIARDADIPL